MTISTTNNKTTTTKSRIGPTTSPSKASATEKPTEVEAPRQKCPYLDTITRTLLDFDFEHSCSVSLSSGPHIYGCLVCGTFFRGKGPHTPAHVHSVETGHAVYVHLSKGTFHCLPDDYEIVGEASLVDVGDALRPVFTEEQIQALDRGVASGNGGKGVAEDATTGWSRDLLGRRYLPGFVGLNNLKKTDCLNTTLQALAHVRPLRDFFLRCGTGEVFEIELTTTRRRRSKHKHGNTTTSLKRKRDAPTNHDGHPDHHQSQLETVTKLHKVDPNKFSHLAQCFGTLIRKMWSDKRFKSTVDPHMLVQAVSVASQKRFTVGKQSEAGDLMAWLLHQIHIGIGGTKKPGSSVIHKVFQGAVGITTRRRVFPNDGEGKANSNDGDGTDDDNNEDDDDDRIGSGDEEEILQRDRDRLLRKQTLASAPPTIVETSTDTPFLQLTLDIPEKPLFKDDDGGLVIPQEPLVNVLKKFDGVSFLDAIDAQSKRNGGGSGEKVKRRYRLKKLPEYLILHLARFKRNGFYNEKNPTIVAFPVKNLDLGAYVHTESNDNENGGKPKVPSIQEVDAMSTNELKTLLAKHGCSHLASSVIEKDHLRTVVKDFVATSLPTLLSHKYDLVANITHDIPAEVGREGQSDPLEEGSYRCHVQHKGSGQWYEMQDLHVQTIMPQQIGLSESYVLIFEKKKI